MKYCIVTCIFNNYEPIREPLEMDPNADYFLFTDDKSITSSKWKVIYLQEFDTNKLLGIQKTYIFKYTFYKYIDISKYKYFIQLDSSIVIYKSLVPIINYMDTNNYDISVAPHYWRNNFNDEYTIWKYGRRLNQKYIDIFFNNIKDYDFNSIKGLVECSFKIYHNTKYVLEFIDSINNMMTKCNNNEDANDQCYFTYCLYKYLDKLNVNYHSASLYRYSNYMKMYVHGTNNTTQNNELIYQSYNINFLGRDIKINKLDAYDNF